MGKSNRLRSNLSVIRQWFVYFIKRSSDDRTSPFSWTFLQLKLADASQSLHSKHRHSHTKVIPALLYCNRPFHHQQKEAAWVRAEGIVRKHLRKFDDTSEAIRDDVINIELLGMETSSSEGNDLKNFIIGIKGKRCIQEFLGKEWSLLNEIASTLVRRVGRICLYLSADSLFLKISSKESAASWC